MIKTVQPRNGHFKSLHVSEENIYHGSVDFGEQLEQLFGKPMIWQTEFRPEGKVILAIKYPTLHHQEIRIIRVGHYVVSVNGFVICMNPDEYNAAFIEPEEQQKRKEEIEAYKKKTEAAFSEAMQHVGKVLDLEMERLRLLREMSQPMPKYPKGKPDEKGPAYVGEIRQDKAEAIWKAHGCLPNVKGIEENAVFVRDLGEFIAEHFRDESTCHGDNLYLLTIRLLNELKHWRKGNIVK